MKIAPAIILALAGAAFSGWLLELFTAAETARTASLQEILVPVLAWLAGRLGTILDCLRNRG